MTTEDEFRLQELKRLKAEQKINSFNFGSSLPTIDGFFEEYTTLLSENPLLKEFLRNQAEEFKDAISYLNSSVQDKNIDVSKVLDQLNLIDDRLRELLNNFNFYMQKTLENSEKRFNLVRKAVDDMNRVMSQY